MEQRISPDEKIKKGVSVKTLYNKDSISIMQKVAPQFGVEVAILKKEGETYTHFQIDKQQIDKQQIDKQTEYRGSVPQGKSYISIKSQKNDIHDFWEAVRAEETSQQHSSNPPKI